MVIDSVCENFGCYSGTMLESFTHDEDPWRLTRGGLDENEKSNKIIEKQLIEEYFSRVIKENKIERPEEIDRYSYKMFMQKKFKH